MEKKAKTVVHILAFHSYTIVKGLTSVVIVVSAFLRSVFEYEVTLTFTAGFFLVIGMFVGYSVAFYSIKLLRDRDVKSRFPLN